jgi:hypothetical protein
MSRIATLKVIALWSLIWSDGAQLSAVRADEVAAGTPAHSVRRMKTISTPKPPYPAWLLHGHRLGQRPSAQLVVVSIAVEHGKITQVIPKGDNPVLANYVADWIQKKWLFTPEMTGTFKLPIYFNE